MPPVLLLKPVLQDPLPRAITTFTILDAAILAIASQTPSET